MESVHYVGSIMQRHNVQGWKESERMNQAENGNREHSCGSNKTKKIDVRRIEGTISKVVREWEAEGRWWRQKFGNKCKRI